MPQEPISPELALVDPELAARARAALPHPAAAPRRMPAPAPVEAPPVHHERQYPFWARVTAALWLLVLGILIGGAAIPHAQDKPRVVPKDEDPLVTVCKPKTTLPTIPETTLPTIPGTSFPNR
jgi:hypothetical protein